MRHDAHYVESLTGEQFKTFGRYINVTEIDPNPEQPRVDVGDLQELTASIADQGVLEPLLVRPVEESGRWMIIAGERRWRAACAAGLEQVPCVEMAVDDQKVAEIALIENLQRKDLTIWEEADALQALVEKFGYTHEELAKKIGKSRTTITESLTVATTPDAMRTQCRDYDISTKASILHILRQPTEEHMQAAILALAEKRRLQSPQHQSGAKQDIALQGEEKSIEKKRDFLSKPSKYTIADGVEGFVLQIKFNRGEVSMADVEASLRCALDNIRNGKLNN